MEATFEHHVRASSSPIQPLPEDRSHWPNAAAAAHDCLVHELNRWCRDNDWPSTLNSWIAEEAVRREF